MTDEPFQPEPPPWAPPQDVAIAAAVDVMEPIEPQPWGPWATIGWTLLAMLIGLFISLVLGILLGVGMMIISIATGGSPDSFESMIESHAGLLEMTVSIPVVCAVLAFLVLPIRLRKFRYADYVGLIPSRPSQYLIAFFATIGFIAIEEALILLMDRAVPPWMIKMWETSGSVLLLMFVVVIVAPVTEEIFFRGFMFRGLSGTRLGPALPIVATSLVWAVIHVQYGLFEIALIFLLGLLLGWFRHWTGSVKPAILMHLTVNLISMVMFATMYAGT